MLALRNQAKIGFNCQNWQNYGILSRWMTSSSMSSRLDEALDSIREAGTWKPERVIRGKQQALVEINNNNENKNVINFCANNYLGLSSHPAVISAGMKALEQFGAGLSSVRFICGTQTLHKDLEAKIAKFHGREDAILYASCFDANAGLFEQLVGVGDAVFSDALNHASIIDGIRLCKATKFRYEHRDMKDLENKLKQSCDEGSKVRLIATDGVFSMDGNVAPLDAIVDLAEKYEALVFVDDCHATGFVGKEGRGVEELFGLEPGRVDIINSTLGKAMGGAAGGYTAASSKVVELLRQRSRPYLFSNSLPPPVVASAMAAFDVLDSDSSLLERIASNTKLFRSEMNKAGFKIAGQNHPICPVMLGDARLAAQIAEDMLDEGIYVIGFSYPVVPRGAARIRVQISAAHSKEDVERTVEAFVRVGRRHQVIN